MFLIFTLALPTSYGRDGSFRPHVLEEEVLAAKYVPVSPNPGSAIRISIKDKGLLIIRYDLHCVQTSNSQNFVVPCLTARFH